MDIGNAIIQIWDKKTSFEKNLVYKKYPIKAQTCVGKCEPGYTLSCGELLHKCSADQGVSEQDQNGFKKECECLAESCNVNLLPQNAQKPAYHWKCDNMSRFSFIILLKIFRFLFISFYFPFYFPFFFICPLFHLSVSLFSLLSFFFCFSVLFPFFFLVIVLFLVLVLAVFLFLFILFLSASLPLPVFPDLQIPNIIEFSITLDNVAISLSLNAFKALEFFCIC